MPQFLRTGVWIAVLAVSTALVAQDAPTPQRPQDVMEKAIADMAAQVKNARMRLDNNMIGMSRDAPPALAGSADGDLSSGGRIGEGAEPESALGSGKAAACCVRNVQEMMVQLKTFEAVLTEYGRRLDGDRDAMAKLMTMHRSWKEMEGGLTLFNATESRQVARSALGMMSAALADLGDVHDGLLECCVDRPGKNQQ